MKKNALKQLFFLKNAIDIPYSTIKKGILKTCTFLSIKNAIANK